MKSNRFRVLRGLNYPDPKGKPDPKTGERPEKRVEAGDVIDDAPSHGTGRCGSSCARPGDHDWMLQGSPHDPVLEPVEAGRPEPEGGEA